MNTIWHIFWTYVLFRKKKYVKLPLLFSFIPDIPWYTGLALGYLIFGPGAFDKTFGNPYVLGLTWMMHSFVVVLIVYIVLKLFKKNWVPLVYGWVFHIALDGITHVSDAYPLFWPLPIKAIPSFISWWEIQYHSVLLGMLNITLVIIFIIYLLFEEHNKLSKTTKRNDCILFVLAIFGVILGFILTLMWGANFSVLNPYIHLIPIPFFAAIFIKRKCWFNKQT